MKKCGLQVAALLLAAAGAGSAVPFWRRGSGVVSVSATEALSYSVAFDAGPAIPGDLTVYCLGRRHSTSAGSLVPAKSGAAAGVSNGTAAGLGPYDQIELAFKAASDVAGEGCSHPDGLVVAKIRYHPVHDAFVFSLGFPGGLAGPSPAPLPRFDGHSTSWAAGTLPLTAEFPALLAVPGGLSFVSVGGNMLGGNFQGPAPVADYTGGMTLGPVLLFDGDGAAANRPASMVLSPLTHHKAVFTVGGPAMPAATSTAANQAAADPTGPAGVYHEDTHGRMHPIICTESNITGQLSGSAAAGGAVLAFENQDPRAHTVWTTANCTLTSKLECTAGTFWTAAGKPFATKNWSAQIKSDFSQILVSDGSVWCRGTGPPPGPPGPPPGPPPAPGAPRRIAVGISGYIGEVRPDFEMSAVLAGRKGIHAGWEGWGRTLQASGGTRRLALSSDLYSRQVHYMTDNGAYYCFCNRFNSNKGPDGKGHYDVPMYKTIAALQKYHAEIFPKLFADRRDPAAATEYVGLYHLDPFWHSHHDDGHCDGVTASNWSHSSFHWPKGLGVEGFPTTRWQMLYMLLAGPSFPTDLAGGNVYEKEWPMEAQDIDTVVGGSGERCCGQNAQVAASHSHAFWDRVLGEAVADNNLHAMVIDTLQVWATGFTSRINDTDTHELWLDGYLGPSGGIGPGGASKYGLPVRIDQSLPSDHMLSAARNFTAVVSARCGGDMDGGNSWTQMATTGTFLASIGIRPVMDVLWTTAAQPGNTEHIAERRNIEHELVIAVLTTGPVGFGDMVNGTNASRLLLATREDGTIQKPAHAAARLDLTYLGSTAAAPNQCAGQEIWVAPSVPSRGQSTSEFYSPTTDRRANSMVRLAALDGSEANSPGVWWYSILASNVAAPGCAVTPSMLWPLPVTDTALVLREFDAAGCGHGASAASCLSPLSESSPLNTTTPSSHQDVTGSRKWQLFNVAPVLKDGWVLLGDHSNYVSLSPQRIAVEGTASTDANGDDSMLESELYQCWVTEAGPECGLKFAVLGTPGFTATISVVVPPSSRPLGSSVVTDVENAMAGTVATVSVPMGTEGCRRVRCTVNAGCLADAATGCN